MFSADELERLNERGDPELDALVIALAEQSNGVKTVAALFKQVQQCERLSSEIIESLREQGLFSDALTEFFEQRSRVPKLPWIVPQQIAAGGEFFRKRGLMTFVGLAFASLPSCYCWSIEAEVLTTTGRLAQSKRIARRIPETAQLVLDVGRSDGFADNGVAIQAAHKIRLMHSTIRYMLLTDPAAASVNPDRDKLKRWDRDKLGVPISQEFLAATLLSFHYVVLQSMQKLSMRLDAADVTGYLHLWNLTGWFIGIEESTLAKLVTMDDAQQLYSLEMSRRRKQTESAHRLSSTLINYTTNNVIEGVFGKSLNPLTHTPRVLTRYLSGRTTADALSLKFSTVDYLLYLPIVWGTKLVGFLDNYRVFQRVTTALTAYAARHLWQFTHEDNKRARSVDEDPLVYIPEEHASTWGLKLNRHHSP